MVTIKSLRALKPGIWLSDGGARGAGTLVFRRTGDVVRAYFRHTQTDGSRYALPIGHFDESGRDGISLAQARERAGELSKLYLAGVKDLREHLETEAAQRRQVEAEQIAATAKLELASTLRERTTLRDLCEAYVELLRSQGKKKSATDVNSAFKVHVLEKHPDIAKQQAKEVTAHDIAAIVREVRQSGKERTAGIVRSYLRAAFSIAIRAPFDSAVPTELANFGVDLNPVEAIPTIPVRAGQRTLNETELKAYFNALDGSLIDQALKLAVLAGGQRMSQLLRSCVNDYDPGTGVLRLWDGKGRRHDAREHLLPLGKNAQSLVAFLVERAKQLESEAAAQESRAPDPNPSLWCSRPGVRMVDSTPGKRVAEVSRKLKIERFDLRSVRRSIETMLARLGISRDVRAQLLSHGLTGVQQVHYDRHSYMQEKRRALEAWETALHSDAAR